MAATAATCPEPAPSARAQLTIVTDEGVDSDLEAEQRAAEHGLLRDIVIGIVVGMVVCAGIWAVLVTIALAGTDWPLGPPVWMGAGVGLFAGAFFGGWLGTLIGCRRLEAAEHHSLPRAPHAPR